MIKSIWSILLVLLLAPSVQAQYINIYFSDSTAESYSLADVRNIEFVEDEMIMNLIGGSELSWNTSIINYVDYDDLGLGIVPPVSAVVRDFVVYPNPSNGPVTVSFNLATEQNIDVSIYSIDGRLIGNLFSGYATNGSMNMDWQGQANGGSRISNGLYLCTVQCGNQTISRIFILSGK